MFSPRVIFLILMLIISLPLSAQDAERTGAVYATDQALIIVNTSRLNVRSRPDAEDPESIVWTIIHQGERYPALAKTLDEEWILIRISGDTAWVLADAVLLTNPANIPIFGQVTPEEDEAMRLLTEELVAYIKSTVGVRDNLNIRLAPGVQNPIIGRIPYPERAIPIDLFSNGLWYQVEYQGTRGWVSGVYVTFPPGLVAPLINNNAQG